MKVVIRKYSGHSCPDWLLKHQVLSNAWHWVFDWWGDFQEKRRVNVRIDPWDTWSMDYTLAEIILPMLEQLVDDKHGAPNVDPEDVPEELRPNEAEIESCKKDGTTDIHFFARWDWILDEMIYAFRCKVEDYEPHFRIDDIEEAEKERERIKNGFRLFGKYYESLWS